MKTDYKISVPFMNASCDTDAHRAQFLDMIRRIGARRVFLVMPRHLTDSPARRASLALLKKNIAFFKDNGIEEVGTWFTAMGHGGPLDHEDGETFPPFRRLVGFFGTVLDDTFCLSDPQYQNAVAEYIAEMGNCGADIIQLDDDLRLGHRNDDIGCVCDYHMAEFARRTGREWSREELYEAVYSGAPNETRQAWFALMRDMFYDFARVLRARLDTVSEDIRLGFCSGPMSYDPDCTDAAELARIFAGKTRPFLRGMGAPYWAMHRGWHSIEDVISYHRLERVWMKKSPDVEFFAEGDVYPRPRYRVPGWLLETFDTALRADGSFDGILKYVFDYVQTPTYETGYLALHEHHMPLYREIETAFTDGTARGLYIYEEEHQLLNSVLPTPPMRPMRIAKNSFSASVVFANRLCLPAVFEDSGDAVCLSGCPADHIPVSLLDRGAVIDLDAAKRLLSRGIDCGVISVSDAPTPDDEIFASADDCPAEHIRPMTEGVFGHVALCGNAEVLSYFMAGETRYPAVWYYENNDGQRFLGYAFEWCSVDWESPLLLSYARQRQAIAAITRLQNGITPAAYCPGEPHLYILAKDMKDGSRAVGIWNCFGDEIPSPRICLDRAFSSVSFLDGKTGVLAGNTVTLSVPLPAHGFVGFLLK